MPFPWYSTSLVFLSARAVWFEGWDSQIQSGRSRWRLSLECPWSGFAFLSRDLVNIFMFFFMCVCVCAFIHSQKHDKLLREVLDCGWVWTALDGYYDGSVYLSSAMRQVSGIPHRWQVSVYTPSIAWLNFLHLQHFTQSLIHVMCRLSLIHLQPQKH